MIAHTDKCDLYPLELKKSKKQVLFLFLIQLWLVGGIVLYLGFDFEYLFFAYLGIIALSIIGLLHFKAPSWIIFGILFLAVLPNYGFFPLRLFDCMLLILMFSLIFTWLMYARSELRIEKVDLYIILYLCTAMVSGFVSRRPITYHFIMVVYGFLTFFGTRTFIKEDKQLKGALFLLQACALLIILQMTSSFMHYHPELITTSFSRRQADVSWGSTNYLAALLVLMLPLALSLFFSVKRIIWKVFSLGLVAGMITSVLWTVSRTGALCLFIILIMFLLSFNKRKAMIVLVGLLMAYYLLNPFIAKVLSRFSSHDVISYFAVIERYDLWKKSWKIFMEHPILGVGMGNAEVVTVLKSRSTNPHNLIFKSLAETGIVGFALLLLILKELIKALFKLRKIVKKTNKDRIIYIGFLATLSVSVFNRTLEVIGDRYEVIFWFIMGLLFFVVERKTSNPSFTLFESSK
jgi:O-antigen ligase